MTFRLSMANDSNEEQPLVPASPAASTVRPESEDAGSASTGEGSVSAMARLISQQQARAVAPTPTDRQQDDPA